jgi:hypothetical protein
LGEILINQTSIIEVDSDPSINGISASLSSIAVLNNGSGSKIWIKTTNLDTGWSQVALETDLSSYVTTGVTVNGKQLSSNISLNKGDIGLTNVDNTSDLNKPVSIAQQQAINTAAYYFSIVL